MLNTSNSNRPTLAHRIHTRFKAYAPKDASLFVEYPKPTSEDRVLFFAPHPDDEALAAGGYLHQAVKMGALCTVVLVTDGNRRGLKEIRSREFNAVLAALGIPTENAVCLEYVNGNLHLENVNELQKRFQDIVDFAKPTVVIAPHLSDLHREHKVISEVVREIHELKPSFDLLQYLIHYPPHYPWPRRLAPTAPLLPPVNLSLNTSEWVLFPLTPDEVSHKQSVVELYPSQLKTPILKSLMYSLVRSNELFRILPKK